MIVRNLWLALILGVGAVWAAGVDNAALHKAQSDNASWLTYGRN